MFFLQNGGEIIEIHSGIEVTEFAHIFEPVASHLLKLKQEKVKFAKLLLNSIYGRLAIKIKTTRTGLVYLFTEKEKIKLKNITRYLYYNNVYLVESPLTKTTNVKRNIVVGAIIPAKARIKLYKLIFAVLKLAAKLVYIDTDCLFLETNGVNICFLLKLADFELIKNACFFTEKNYFLTKNNTFIQKGEIKDFFLSFKRKKIGRTTRPFTVTELNH